MRIRTVAAAALLAATLTACLPGGDDKAAPAPTVTVTEPVDPSAACLADLVEAYPKLAADAPMMDQVDACADLSKQEQSDVLRVLSEYDDAAQAAVDAAASEAP
ncbi:hypothetical protein [Streptomyces sp. NBC_01373]|uniref:hypothetical protein n=1 Tax=Streptomyces sp. NBC_01373 TaxID=2903843 RepID=UPI00224DEB80|nr:hypothetical protein [Streptomyces sp. NBC_01373]MCX4699535.1 hypothetical protein [Streptomyces sp. NBC_01373]